jgi:hypothetical protein
MFRALGQVPDGAPDCAARPPDMDALERRTMLLLYRKATRPVGMGQDFFKKIKIVCIT